MAADQGLVDAYNKWGQAKAMQGLMSDPFYQMTLLATQAAQEWTAEKKKDQERAEKKGDAYNASVTESLINATDGYNSQAKETIYNSIATFEGRMNEAVLAKDKKAINQIFGEVQELTSQLREGQELMKTHAAILNGEGGKEYSLGSQYASLNKLVAGENGDYQLFLSTDPSGDGFNKLHFGVKGENADYDVKIGFDDFKKGLVTKASDVPTKITNAINQKIAANRKLGKTDYSEQDFEALVNSFANDEKMAYSLFHDKFAWGNDVTDDESLADKWKEKYPNVTYDWMQIANDEKEIATANNVIGGTTADDDGQASLNGSGYNKDMIQAAVEAKLRTLIENEYTKTYTLQDQKIQADKDQAVIDNENRNRKTSIQVDLNSHISMHAAENASVSIGLNQEFTFEGITYRPDSQKPGEWVSVIPDGTPNGKEKPIGDANTLVRSMDKSTPKQLPNPDYDKNDANSKEWYLSPSEPRGYLMYHELFKKYLKN